MARTSPLAAALLCACLAAQAASPAAGLAAHKAERSAALLRANEATARTLAWLDQEMQDKRVRNWLGVLDAAHAWREAALEAEVANLEVLCCIAGAGSHSAVDACLERDRERLRAAAGKEAEAARIALDLMRAIPR
ncbi:hypothetical protein EZJ19_09580 [Parasulfuritortus cantonensis]|uniref:Lysozyme inhibitor LprI N-terminal domain-containing protein n=1 Tax=Parasulfuritortus cantonensis TaxID=2528202 RepID=A0A4R1BCC6_9PROT|nr:hypothetical protein [Parasulfuritortus cantonensis]TCJ14686.1 hypothetical protein EZJ19_09580 [Parasulfuritortus cantonensis]